MKREEKDLSQVVQQLRLLLVEKEEEIERLRGDLEPGVDSDLPGEGGAPPAGLAREAEEQRATIASLEKTIDEMGRKEKRKLKELEKKLREKEKTIGSLRDSPPGPEDDERLEEALEEIARLKEELSGALREGEGTGVAAEEIARLKDELENARAGAAGRIGELEKTIEEGEDVRGRLSSVNEDLEMSGISLRRAREECRRLGSRSVRLMAACAVLGVLLCISLVSAFLRRGSPSPPEGGMDFITSAENELFEPGDRIRSGAPSPPVGAVAGNEVAPTDAGGREYIVRAGDSLWKICKRELGDPSLAERVARENNLENARALKVGMVLYLPAEKAE